MLKKSVLAVVLLFIATNVWAVRGPQNVSAGTHNLGSTTDLIYGYEVPATNEDEVCIFCHTPHGGTLNVSLWNHNLPDTSVDAFTHYTSTTLSGYFSEPGMENTRPVSTESLLCLGCHDGTTAMNSIVNISNRSVGGLPPNVADGAAMPAMMWGGSNPVIGDPNALPTIKLGRNLTDDHPISFSYTDAQAHVDNTGKLRALADARDNGGVRFFGAANKVECSSCHDPHVNYTASGNTAYTPFLITPNAASALCLACHVK